jgi:peptide/nickel transport system permease protein
VSACVTGAGELRILRTHVLPHLVAPLIVWGTLIVATNVILEAAISFLNLGVRLPTPSWGNLLSSNWGTQLSFNQTVDYTQRTPWVFWLPTCTVFVTVLALALDGEGLRRAIDPESEE